MGFSGRIQKGIGVAVWVGVMFGASFGLAQVHAGVR